MLTVAPGKARERAALHEKPVDRSSWMVVSLVRACGKPGGFSEEVRGLVVGRARPGVRGSGRGAKARECGDLEPVRAASGMRRWS